MNVRWTRRAIQDREDIGDYIAKDNPRAAVAKLAEFPNLGRRGRVPGTRELIPHRSYRLVYRVEDDTVAVIRLIHTSRTWPPAPE